MTASNKDIKKIKEKETPDSKESKAILLINVETSAIVTYDRLSNTWLHGKFPDYTIYELDNFSSQMLVDLTLKDSMKKEELHILFHIRSSTTDQILTVIRMINQLTRAKKEIRAYYIGSHPKLIIAMKKLNGLPLIKTEDILEHIEDRG